MGNKNQTKQQKDLYEHYSPEIDQCSRARAQDFLDKVKKIKESQQKEKYFYQK